MCISIKYHIGHTKFSFWLVILFLFLHLIWMSRKNIYTFFALFFAVVGFFLSSPVFADITSNLIMYNPFDWDILDYSSNSRDFVSTETNTYTTGADWSYSWAVRLTKPNYMRLDSTDYISWSWDYTVSYWANWYWITPTETCPWSDTPSHQSFFSLRFGTANDFLHASSCIASRFRRSWTSNYTTHTFLTTTGLWWYHYTWVRDAQNWYHYTYINWILTWSDTQLPYTWQSTNINPQFYLISSPSLADEVFIDDFRIYNRALTSWDVNQLYNDIPDTTPSMCWITLDDLCPHPWDRSRLYEEVDWVHYWACWPSAWWLEDITDRCELEVDTWLAQCWIYNKQYYGSGYFPSYSLTGNQLCTYGNTGASTVVYNNLEKNRVWFCQDPLGTWEDIRCDAKALEYIEPICWIYHNDSFFGSWSNSGSLAYLMTWTFEPRFCENWSMSIPIQKWEDIYDYWSDETDAWWWTQTHVWWTWTCTVIEDSVPNIKTCEATKIWAITYMWSDSSDNIDMDNVLWFITLSLSSSWLSSWADTLLRWLWLSETYNYLFDNEHFIWGDANAPTWWFNVFIPIFSNEWEEHYLDYEPVNIQPSDFTWPFTLDCSWEYCQRWLGNYTVRSATPKYVYNVIAVLSAFFYLFLYYWLLFVIVLWPFMAIFHLFKFPTLFLFLWFKEPLNSRLWRLSTMVSFLIVAGVMVSAVIFMAWFFSTFFYQYGFFLHTIFSGIVSFVSGNLFAFNATIFFIQWVTWITVTVFLGRMLLSSSAV